MPVSSGKLVELYYLNEYATIVYVKMCKSDHSSLIHIEAPLIDFIENVNNSSVYRLYLLKAALKNIFILIRMCKIQVGH